jgi:hypothetical protein
MPTSRRSDSNPMDRNDFYSGLERELCSSLLPTVHTGGWEPEHRRYTMTS